MARYAQPGERVVTIEPALTYQGSTYQVHYMTTGDYKSANARLFHVATPKFFTDQQISALVVTKDGKVVTDVETLRQVFLLYTAAYHLYEAPPTEQAPKFRNELGIIIDNPLFIAMEPDQFLRSRRDQMAEALRAILTDQLSAEAKTLALFDQLFQQDPTRLEDGLQAINAIVQAQAAGDALLGAVDADLAQVYADVDTTTAWTTDSSKLLRLAIKLLYISHLQRERADWLTTYVDAFPSAEGTLDRDQIRAAAAVLPEVDNTFAQRANIVKDFVTDETVAALLDATGEAARQASAQFVARMGKNMVSKFPPTLWPALSRLSPSA